MKFVGPIEDGSPVPFFAIYRTALQDAEIKITPGKIKITFDIIFPFHSMCKVI